MRLAQSLPDGVVTLTAKQNSAPGGESNSFTLTPIQPSAALIHIDVDEDSETIYLSMGRGAVYEVPPEGRGYSDLSQLDEVRALCLAAIRSEFRETVWFKGKDVVGGRGWATVGSEEVGVCGGSCSPTRCAYGRNALSRTRRTRSSRATRPDPALAPGRPRARLDPRGRRSGAASPAGRGRPPSVSASRAPSRRRPGSLRS
jgi:hypothetical protein